jgi:hypothetical protein
MSLDDLRNRALVLRSQIGRLRDSVSLEPARILRCMWWTVHAFDPAVRDPIQSCFDYYDELIPRNWSEILCEYPQVVTDYRNFIDDCRNYALVIN